MFHLLTSKRLGLHHSTVQRCLCLCNIAVPTECCCWLFVLCISSSNKIAYNVDVTIFKQKTAQAAARILNCSA